MTTAGKRFTVLQRFLHWLMAICSLAMLFIGVGMKSTVAPKYVPLLATRKNRWRYVLVLALIRLAVRLRYGAPPVPPIPKTDEARGASLTLCALCADDRPAPSGLTMQWTGAWGIVLYGDIRLPTLLTRATPCTRCFGTRISISPSRFSRSSCSFRRSVVPRACPGGTACSSVWLPRPRTTRRLQ